MSIAIIITLCGLLLLAYLFDLSSSLTKIPSVILLLILGWGVRQITSLLEISIPNLTPALPVLGTIGLVLIVFDGSLELEIKKGKRRMIIKSLLMSILPILTMAFVLGFIVQQLWEVPLKTSLINVVPLTIISSAIAIPSVKNQAKANQEFITYETSMSDISGVILFNFLILNETIELISFGNFVIDLIIIIFISAISTVLLLILLSQIKHHVKFIPIILLIILVYSISKIYHLPALILILVFGMILGNLVNLERFRFLKRFPPDILEAEVKKLKELTSEVAFLIRSLFFLLFGYLIQNEELINPETLGLAIGIVIILFLIRFIYLKILRVPVYPFLFIAPRGLITILLFLSIPADKLLSIMNKSLIIQVIVITSLIMVAGMFRQKSGSRGEVE